MRIGIIGGGFGARVQAPIINTHPKFNLVAIATVTQHQIAKKVVPPIHLYKNWMEMIDRENLDILFVSSLPNQHFEMVKYALEKEVHVVCEKPFTVSSKESAKLIKISERKQVKLMIDFEWRFLPLRQKLKTMMNNQVIGALLHMEYHVADAMYDQLNLIDKGWMGEKSAFGGMLGAIGSHMLDTLSWLTDREVAELNGMLHTHVPFGLTEIRDADDAFFIHGKLQGGGTFSLQLLSGMHHKSANHLRIFGDRGTIECVEDEELLYGEAGEKLKKIEIIKQHVPAHLTAEVQAYYPAFYPFIEAVYDYVSSGERDKNLPLAEDGHRNQLLLDRVRYGKRSEKDGN